MPLFPGAEPYVADGGSIGVLLIHGFIDFGEPVNPWSRRTPVAPPSTDSGSAPGNSGMATSFRCPR